MVFVFPYILRFCCTIGRRQLQAEGRLSILYVRRALHRDFEREEEGSRKGKRRERKTST